MSPRASVVIPAHNEEGVLARGLTTLLRGAEPGELEVIVVANACTDATAAVARAHGVRVIETRAPGKTHALRLGDAAASTFPRLYADADVDLTADSVRVLVDTLARPGVLATSPVPHYDLTGARPSARRLHKVHELLMADRRGLAGAGVYCLNEAGHARVAPFPDVISDDGLVHRSFAPGERVVSGAASSVVRPTTTFGASLRRRVRVRQGNQELDARGLPRAEGRLVRGRWSRSCASGASPPSTRLVPRPPGRGARAGRWQRVRGAEVSWGTDGSSRQARRSPLLEGTLTWQLITHRGFTARSGGRPGSEIETWGLPEWQRGQDALLLGAAARRHERDLSPAEVRRLLLDDPAALRRGAPDLRGGRGDAGWWDERGHRLPRLPARLPRCSGTARRSSPPRATPARTRWARRWTSRPWRSRARSAGSSASAPCSTASASSHRAGSPRSRTAPSPSRPTPGRGTRGADRTSTTPSARPPTCCGPT